MKRYIPSNWYWYVGGDQTKAFSSAVGDYVPASEATFLAWCSDGTVPTNIDTEANLGALLADLGIRPTNASVLDGYTSQAASHTVLKAEFKVLFNHENRLRAIERTLSLNGSPANLTWSQAVAAVKTLM